MTKQENKVTMSIVYSTVMCLLPKEKKIKLLETLQSCPNFTYFNIPIINHELFCQND